MLEQWICTMDRQGQAGCGFTLVIGVSNSGPPDKCPKCGGRAWDIIGDTQHCRATKGLHQWRKGIDRQGLPHLDPDQVCMACGAIPVMKGIN